MFHTFLVRATPVVLVALLGCGSTWAQSLQVQDAWARATVPGQKAGSAFMTLHATQDLTLTGVDSPAAQKSEIHTMEQDGDVMRMRALQELKIAAGQTVQLTPSGTHFMLMNLHQPLVEGDDVTLTLQGRTESGEPVAETVQVPVLGIAARNGAGDMHGHGHGHAHEHDHGQHAGHSDHDSHHDHGD